MNFAIIGEEDDPIDGLEFVMEDKALGGARCMGQIAVALAVGGPVSSLPANNEYTGDIYAWR